MSMDNIHLHIFRGESFIISTNANDTVKMMEMH